MASADRSTATRLIQELISNSHSYSFFQAVKLLKEYQQLLENEQGRSQLKKTLLQYSVNPELWHQNCDIDGIEFKQSEQYTELRVTVNFMGLYGAVTPLPVFYTETILQTDDEDEHSRAFMDLFNHRLISLVYKCWEKYRYYLQYRQEDNDQFTNWMYALTGLYQSKTGNGLRQDSSIQWSRLLPFTGLLGMRCHSASLIESILRTYFRWKDICIKSNILRYVEIESDQQNRLGFQCASLGDDLILGERIEDRSGKFRIVVSRLPYELFCQFLPGAGLNSSLKELLDFLLRDQLDYDIELQLLEPEVPGLSLDSQCLERLGLTTWMGENKKTGKSVLLAGR